MKKLMAAILHPFRELRRAYYLRVLRKAQWIVANGLHQTGLSRPERRKLMKESREVVTVMADKIRMTRRQERGAEALKSVVREEPAFKQS